MKLKRNVKKVLKLIFGITLVVAFMVVLMSSSRKQITRNFNEKLVISINYDDGNYFISREEVEKNVQNWLERPVSTYTINELSIRELEDFLIQNPYIQEADVFADASAKLHVEVRQRKPLLRVINRNGVSYYLHESGGKMPLSNKFTPRVVVATGHISDNGKSSGAMETESLKSLFEMARFIQEDAFMNALVDQVIVKKNGEFELIPKIDNHAIAWGEADNLESKRDKLKLFYRKGMKKAGWKSYQLVDLRFKDQIVCKKR